MRGGFRENPWSPAQKATNRPRFLVLAMPKQIHVKSQAGKSGKGQFSNVMGSVRLQVPKEFATQALEALNKPDEITPFPESGTAYESKPAVRPC